MTIRLGWVGTGHIHTPGFVNEVLKRGIACAGVWDHDVDRASMNADKLGGIVKVVSELVADETVDGYVVCSETVRHLDLARQLVTTGKPIFIEKPIGFSGEQSVAIRDAFEASKCVFQTGYFYRGNGKVRALKKLVDDGFFGTITKVRASNCHGGALNGWFDNEWRWMADRTQAGVGAFGDLGTHGLDLLMWLFGPVSSVTGALSAGTNRYPGCEELGESLLKFSSGVIGTLTSSWDDVADPMRLQVCGTKGQATFGADLLVAGPDGKFSVAEPEPDVPGGFNAFLSYLAGEKVELVTPREATDRDVVMDAIYRGAESQTWVTI